MKASAREALWDRLIAAGLVTGDLPSADSHSSPWYVRAMLGISGWIGALFLLGFLGVAFEFLFENEVMAIIAGAAFCVAAAFILRADRNDFAAQFAFALSLAGQALFAFGIIESLNGPSAVVFLVFALFEIALVFSIRNALHRMLSTWAAVIALYFALADMGIYGVLAGLIAVVMALLWLREFVRAGNGELLRPVAYGLTLSLIQLGATPFLQGWWMLSIHGGGTPLFLPWARWLNLGLLAIAFFYTVWHLLKREGVDMHSRTGKCAWLGALLAVLLSFDAPGIAIGLLVALLGFANGNRLLLGLGVLSLTSYLSQYYYSLHMTLLNKSIVLVATGIVLLILRYAVQTYLQPAQAARAHA